MLDNAAFCNKAMFFFNGLLFFSLHPKRLLLILFQALRRSQQGNSKALFISLLLQCGCYQLHKQAHDVPFRPLRAMRTAPISAHHGGPIMCCSAASLENVAPENFSPQVNERVLFTLMHLLACGRQCMAHDVRTMPSSPTAMSALCASIGEMVPLPHH